jgi:hypothetical protein
MYSIRAARCLGVDSRRTVMRSRTAGSGFDIVGTGGSWDSSPDPINSVRRGSVSRKRSTASPIARQRLARGMPGWATASMKMGTAGGVSSEPRINCNDCANPWSARILWETAGSSPASIRYFANPGAAVASTFSGPGIDWSSPTEVASLPMQSGGHSSLKESLEWPGDDEHDELRCAGSNPGTHCRERVVRPTLRVRRQSVQPEERRVRHAEKGPRVHAGRCAAGRSSNASSATSSSRFA